MLRINRVTIGSAFRVSAALFVAIYLVIAAFSLLITATAEEALRDLSCEYGNCDYHGSGLTSAGLLYTLCCIPIFGIVGGLMGAFTAFVYNIIAGWVGGLEIEVVDVYAVMAAKYKRDPYGPGGSGYQDYPPGPTR